MVILQQHFPLGRFHANPWKAFPFDDPIWRVASKSVALDPRVDRSQPPIRA
jgi:hypothetical protein